MGFKLEQSVIASSSESPKQDVLDNILKKEISLFGNFYGSKKKESFYSELAVLLKAGIHLREALDLIRENQKKDKLRQFYSSMLEQLDSGYSFAEILSKRNEFTEYEQYSVQIGEESGNLIKITEELGRYFAQKNEQRRNLMNALTYPMIILGTAILVVVFMLRMVVPMFEDIFKQNGVELPSITVWIISASNFIKDFGWILLLGLITLIVLRKPIFNKPGIKGKKDAYLLRLPFIGEFIRTIYLAQFTQTVALLTASKVPMLNSIQMVKRMIAFEPLQKALNSMEQKIVSGSSLHESIKGTKLFDNRMISLIKVAEETNQTEYIFDKLSLQYQQEVQQKSKMLSTVMEPIIIVVIGFFVGVILVSMYLPMFRLSSVLGG
ncbi:type II secretion system F family protein [Muricauda sp. 2012CJ35-5]|uniref:Type II secretion system F family protein n=1 Tax=Flagellimonas spongiicola TaxID=2942208 RepID=A0ABT0PVN2_9FLAO|nr:type II secretion system F family protein [Allomuricauda spongiicola]MCL6275450.1 type II secretion system F family protein [Allomuricauda spongiicola]